MSSSPSSSGTLYMVATPIGNLGDMSFRAIETLKKSNRILCEDTRHSLPLLAHYGISAPLIALHDHNESQKIDLIVGYLRAGETLSLISDAGTPAISDPGAVLVEGVVAKGFAVRPIPGACAAIAAFSVMGLVPHHRHSASGGFAFAGFLPHGGRAREDAIIAYSQLPLPVIYYEAPHRLKATLTDFLRYYSADHPIYYAREMTKVYESFGRHSLSALLMALDSGTVPCLGEWVLVVLPKISDGSAVKSFNQDTIARKMQAALAAHLSPSQLARAIAQVTDCPRQQIYQTLMSDESACENAPPTEPSTD